MVIYATGMAELQAALRHLPGLRRLCLSFGQWGWSEEMPPLTLEQPWGQHPCLRTLCLFGKLRRAQTEEEEESLDQLRQRAPHLAIPASCTCSWELHTASD